MLKGVHHDNEKVRLCAIRALGQPHHAFKRPFSATEDRIILATLIDLLDDRSGSIRAAAARHMYYVLEARGSKKALHALAKRLSDPEAEVRDWVIHTIGLLAAYSSADYDYASLVVPLTNATKDQSERVRLSADNALRRVTKRLGHE